MRKNDAERSAKSYLLPASLAHPSTMASLMSWVSDHFTVHAEASHSVPSTPANTESVTTKNSADKTDTADDDDETEEAVEEAEEEPEEEEEEEEEEEAEDQKPAIVEQCEQTAACAPLKHHFDECQERVLNHSGDDEHHEDCVEEMFHLMHCVDACMAPKLFAQLK